MSIGIVGIGGYLPDRVVTNDEIEVRTGYDRDLKNGLSLDAWARDRHGAVRRHHAAPGEGASDLATKAAREALATAGIEVDEIDLIVMATFTSDYRVPPAAALVQTNLGSRARFVQVDAACTGFLDASQVAMGMMHAFGYHTALVVTADRTSFLTDPSDWLSMTVFGDGAGAVILRDVEAGYGFRTMSAGSDGDLGDFVFLPAGGSKQPVTAAALATGAQYWRFKYGEIHRWAVDRMVGAAREVVAKARIRLEDIRWVVPHQASCRIIREAANRLAVAEEKVVLTYPDYGNTSGSSIVLALRHAWREGRLRRGDWVLMCAVGAGMAWSAATYRWSGLEAVER
jgi:3-oxoacyl-[acyl-carrier-protein] synthase-3